MAPHFELLSLRIMLFLVPTFFLVDGTKTQDTIAFRKIQTPQKRTTEAMTEEHLTNRVKDSGLSKQES